MATSLAMYIGIDIQAGAKPVTYVALDEEEKLFAIHEGDGIDALSFAAGQRAAAIIAVTCPSAPNTGRMTLDEVRQQFSPPPEAGRFHSLREAEYQLMRLGVEIPPTPGADEPCSPWVKRGFSLVRWLEKLGYCAYSPDSASVAPTVQRQWLEVPADAAFWAWLGVNPLPQGTLEGRIQRQLALEDQKMAVPDAMEFFEEITRHKILRGTLPMDYILSQGELNARMAAHVAWTAAHKPKLLQSFGNPEDGLLYLPVHKPSSDRQ